MGTFREDYQINVSKLIKLWVAEGFVKPSKTQSLEEVAEDYIKDLVDRNLILNRRIGLDGEIKSCSIHDLLRDLCLEKAEKENFICVMRVGDIRQGIDTERCFVFNQGRVSKPCFEDLNIVESAFLARSLAGDGDSMSNKFKMLRVLNAPDGYYSEDYMLKQVNLRYISIYLCLVYEKKSLCLHSSISLLWNLQMLTINGAKIVAPLEIWEMQQLRHVNVTSTIWLPDPPPPPPPLSNRPQDHDEFVVMRNLQTLERVRDLRLTEEVCKRIPNIKRLSVVYEKITSYEFGRLHKLNGRPRRVGLLQNLTFLSSLQELYLRYSYLHWEDLTMIGSLPHLRLLLLGDKSVIGSEWNPVEGEFLSLRSLKLINCNDLMNWNADKSHFPVLEKLSLDGLRNLNEIPSDFGEIATLAEIKLYKCSECSSISAVRILDEQESFGNESLGVKIGFPSREEVERFKEKIEQFGSSTSNNLEMFSR